MANRTRLPAAELAMRNLGNRTRIPSPRRGSGAMSDRAKQAWSQRMQGQASRQSTTRQGTSDRAKQAWAQRMQGQADFYAQRGYVPSNPNRVVQGMSDRAKQAWAQRMQGQADFYAKYGYVPSDPDMARRAQGRAQALAQAQPDPLARLLEQQRKIEEERRRRLEQQAAAYRRLLMEQQSAGLEAIDSDVAARRADLEAQLSDLDPARQRALREISEQRAADVTAGNQAALRSGMVHSGLRAQAQAQALSREAEGESLVEQNYQKERTRLESAIAGLEAERARRRAELKRQIEAQLFAFRTQLAQTGL